MKLIGVLTLAGVSAVASLPVLQRALLHRTSSPSSRDSPAGKIADELVAFFSNASAFPPGRQQLADAREGNGTVNGKLVENGSSNRGLESAGPKWNGTVNGKL